jgi:Ca2+-dependent lipid-binding protein
LWNEELVLYPTNPEYDVVDIRLYDFDASSNNDLLGELEYPVALTVGKPPKEEWKQVMIKKGPTTFTPGSKNFFI